MTKRRLPIQVVPYARLKDFERQYARAKVEAAARRVHRPVKSTVVIPARQYLPIDFKLRHVLPH
jgi:hypothetical protein